MVAILTQGHDMLFQPVASRAEVMRLRLVLGTHRAYIIYEGHLLCPIRMDNMVAELDEEAVQEFLYGNAYPKIMAEGRLIKKNGKYRKPGARV